MAYPYMERADQAKFGSLLSNLKFQYSLSHNQYHKTLAESGSILDQHQWNDGLNSKRLIKRHPDTKSKIRKPIINPKNKQSRNSHLHKQKVCAIVVDSNGIYNQCAKKG